MINETNSKLWLVQTSFFDNPYDQCCEVHLEKPSKTKERQT